jgi:hypothetical protein
LWRALEKQISLLAERDASECLGRDDVARGRIAMTSVWIGAIPSLCSGWAADFVSGAYMVKICFAV